MACVVIMPKQGLLMEEGTITQWLVKEGSVCAEGQPLFEMETDKLTITIDASASGTLLKILHPAGDCVPITQPIAIIGEPGENISELLRQEPLAAAESLLPAIPAASAAAQTASPPAQLPKAAASPRAKRLAEEAGINLCEIPGSGPDGLIVERDISSYLDAQPKSTPLAASIAKLHGVDLSLVSGTGANGRITSADLRQDTPAPQPVFLDAHGERTVKMSAMRKAVSRNMHASLQTMAQANHRMQADMTAAVSLREQCKAAGSSISYHDIIIRCAARALTEFPDMNASIDGDSIVYHSGVHIGLAVSVPGGLIVPVIRNADCIDLREIAARSSELVAKARASSLSDTDYRGGTFTVTSLGMYDVDSFTAIINPPEAGILAVGKIVKTPVVIHDEIAIRSMCTLSLTYDHRLVDGAYAASFLQRIKALLQSPCLLL